MTKKKLLLSLCAFRLCLFDKEIKLAPIIINRTSSASVHKAGFYCARVRHKRWMENSVQPQVLTGAGVHPITASFLKIKEITCRGIFIENLTLWIIWLLNFRHGAYYAGWSPHSVILHPPSSNEWVASNRILMFVQGFLGSPRGKHCNSQERNV